MTSIAPWLARWPAAKHPGTVKLTIAAGETLKFGDLVYKNGSSEAVKVTTVNPAQIFGMAQEANAVEDGTSVLVIQATEKTKFAFMGSRDPVSGDKGNDVDLAFDGSVLVVDPDSTSATRVNIFDVDIPRKLYFVTILSAYRQS